MTGDDAPLGILAALPEEAAAFGAAFVEGRRQRVAGIDLREGRLDGRAVVLAAAGLGKVQASLGATLLCDRFGCRALLFSGVAGGLDPALGVGDVVVADAILQHDYGALVAGALTAYPPGVPPLPGLEGDPVLRLDPALAARLRVALAGVALQPVEGRPARLVFGTVATGDAFVNCEATRRRLHTAHGAAAVEMEGAAVAQVATRFGVPWVVIRALSDLAGETSHRDWRLFLDVVTVSAATVLRRAVAALDGSRGALLAPGA